MISPGLARCDRRLDRGNGAADESNGVTGLGTPFRRQGADAGADHAGGEDRYLGGVGRGWQQQKGCGKGNNAHTVIPWMVAWD